MTALTMDAYHFFRAWMRDPLRVASVTPSGKALADLIVREIGPQTGRVIELGPGTGVFTRALLRRGAPQRPTVLTAGTLRLDPARRVVERDSTPIELTPREYGVLEYLMRHKDVVVTKNEMLEHVWDAHYAGPDNVVEVYVGYVRRKIDTPFGTNTIQTVRGAGYRLDSGELEVVSDS